MAKLDEHCLETERRIIDTDLLLGCNVRNACRPSKKCIETKQWMRTEGQITHNRHPVNPKMDIEFPEQTACTNDIILKNATPEDFGNNYTCMIGSFLKTTISSDGHDNLPIDLLATEIEPTQASPPNFPVISTPGQDEMINGVIIAGLSVEYYVKYGILAALIVALIIIITVLIVKWLKNRNTEEGNENYLLQRDNGSSV